MNLGNKIKDLRAKNKITQEQLAERLYVSRTAVSKWERNAGYPNIDSLKLIAEVFSITLDELLSSEKLTSIAKEEKKIAINGFVGIFMTIIDFMAVLFMFLPLYGLKEGDFIKSVGLFAADSPLFLKISYCSIIGLQIICGIAQLVVYQFKNQKITNATQILSICFGAFMLLIFIVSLEPYAAVLSLILFSIKAFLLFKIKKT